VISFNDLTLITSLWSSIVVLVARWLACMFYLFFFFSYVCITCRMSNRHHLWPTHPLLAACITRIKYSLSPMSRIYVRTDTVKWTGILLCPAGTREKFDPKRHQELSSFSKLRCDKWTVPTFDLWSTAAEFTCKYWRAARGDVLRIALLTYRLRSERMWPREVNY